ncbi:helix-turn-helix transcriptional regulator [Uliginosibacterium sp. 31-12]|uniref:helix-turn-helix domain-containing protein n=1 Tax=Uliginosibacterium sp. 31-12 TaxID=3062781 RepID=UPI0026E304BA|nr:helix-turn-helix transcriptional regulator [Uliginosibacterium sp. 31-12]MDO6385609.1 helix-turn-helix transcriptional regulator [Uliginosibacterium sp. 31-12]
MSLKENLRAAMLLRKENPNSLAGKSRVPQPTIHRILNGTSADPRRSTVEKLAKSLGVSTDDLYKGAVPAAAGTTQERPDAMPIAATPPAMTVREIMAALETVLALARLPIDALAYPTRSDLEARLQAELEKAGTFAPKRRPQATVWLPKRLTAADIPGVFIDHKQLPGAAPAKSRKKA